MPEQQKYKVKIKSLTPVHIGDNDTKKLSSFVDYVQKHSGIHLIDQNKLESIFSENEQILNDYVKSIRKQSSKVTIDKFLAQYGISESEYLSQKTIPINNNNNEITGTEIHPFICQNGTTYIPGSSLKGAIRNSLLFYNFKKSNLKSIEEVIKHINDEEQQDKKDNNKKTKSNDKSILYKYKEIEKYILGESAQFDLFKYLHVSDSNNISSTGIYKTDTYYLKNQKKVKSEDNSKSFSVNNYECIVPGAESECRIIIKQVPKNNMGNNRFGKIKEDWNNIDMEDIFSRINFLSGILLEREINSFNGFPELGACVEQFNQFINQIKSSENKYAILPIGKGSTFFAKTIGLLFDEKTFNNLRYKMENNKTYNRNFGFKNGSLSNPFPITRSLIGIPGQGYTSPGWVKIYV